MLKWRPGLKGALGLTFAREAPFIHLSQEDVLLIPVTAEATA